MIPDKSFKKMNEEEAAEMSPLLIFRILAGFS